MGTFSITCTIGSVPAWGRKRWLFLKFLFNWRPALLSINVREVQPHRGDNTLESASRSDEDSLSPCRRWGWCCSDITFRRDVTDMPGETAAVTPTAVSDGTMTAWERKAKYPPPIFTFWPFELWPALPLPGVKGGGRRRPPPALHPLSITWTLSHCSCHPEKQLYFDLRAVLIVPTNRHSETVCTDHW